jgi:cargo-transport protein YPP1
VIGLVTTVRAEAELASRNPARPVTGSLPESTVNVLQRAFSEAETEQPEDAYQARACLALGLWSDGKKDEALKIINVELPHPSASDTKEKRRWQGWTYCVAIRAAYLKGSRNRLGDTVPLTEVELCIDSPDEHGSRHEDLFRILDSAPANVQKSDEYCAWLEKFLMRMCLKRPKRSIWNGDEAGKMTTERLLAPFRLWLRYWENIRARKATSEHIPDEGDRRDVWAAYYKTLSLLLRTGYTYPPSSVALFSKVMGTRASNSKLAQSLEIQRVEGVYQDLVLSETTFPTASQFNKEVEDCADQVMENWSIMCGPSWEEDELGSGGREALGRQVLDFLYRAATRTFHSCSILRHLFALHASLGEFHLAEKALDSYLDIALKEKSRVEKSGKDEPTLDKDEDIVQTIVNGIEMLCSYGKMAQAQRAQQLSASLREWLERQEKSIAKRSREKPGSSRQGTEGPLLPSTVTLIHRAIGISKANWARYILEPSERSTLQSEAVEHLRQSLIIEGGRLADPRTLYALATVLAETRDIEGAIATVKQSLAAHSQLVSDGADNDTFDHHSRTLNQMSVVRCWHLLALLLSARQDFEKAEAACDAALESFDGDGHMTRETKLKQLNFFEKQQLVQTKLTQASLLEINSSLEDAINAGGETLRLYAYLFPAPQEKKESQENLKPATGTLRHRGSLFHRKKAAEDSNPASTGPGSVYSNRISEDTTRPPTVSTTVDGSLAPPGLAYHPSHKLHKNPSKRSIRRERPPTATSTHVPATAPQINGIETKADDGVGVAISHDLPTAITTQLEGITASHLPSLTLDDGQSNEYLIPRAAPRISYTPLPPRFSRTVGESYSLGLLSSIWVFIAALYRRAGLYEDSVGAIEEAYKLAENVEGLAAKTNSSVKEFEEPGWGGAPSVEKLWADANAESAYLHVSQHRPQEAIAKFEIALTFYPDHRIATVGLSNLLLDIYTQKLEKPSELTSSSSKSAESKPGPVDSSSPVLSPINALQQGSTTHRRTASSTEAFPSLSPTDPGIAVASVADATDSAAKSSNSQSKPKDLDRLAARDRAFGLLSSLTKLGTSWDDSEAWFALARAYEESGQPDKARDVLWWVVELEEKKPVRGWSCLGQGYSA